MVQTIPAVLVLKATGTAKSDLEALAKEVVILTDFYIRKGVVIVEVLITLTGVKDIIKRMPSIVQHCNAQTAIIYSARQIAANPQEYNDFYQSMIHVCDLNVVSYK